MSPEILERAVELKRQVPERSLDRLITILEGLGEVDRVIDISIPVGDAAIAPPQSTLEKFREEFEYHVREKRCWKSVASTFEEARAKSIRAVSE